MTIATQATLLFNCVPRNLWLDHDEEEYRTVHLTNLYATHTEHFPITVVYQNVATKELRSQPLSEFIRGFTPKNWGCGELCLIEKHQALMDVLGGPQSVIETDRTHQQRPVSQ